MFTAELPAAAQEVIPHLRPMADNALTVLEKRYLDKNDQKAYTEDANGLFWRVSHFLSSAAKIYNPYLSEADHIGLAVKYFRLMRGGYFLPNSPTLANAGTRTGQLSACFVLPIADALANGKDGIFDTLLKAQLIFQTGGGVGYAFSRLREEGALVSSTKGASTGPVGYMDVYDVACENIKQGGMRRGAQMGILRIDSPDIIRFIDYKADLTKLRNFNVSVAVTDAFLEALERGKQGGNDEYNLISPATGKITNTLRASEVWKRIKERAHATGEPGIVLIDRMNAENPVPGLGAYEATNPCGEQPLIPYESCNLGSIALDRYVVTPTEGAPYFAFSAFERDVHTTIDLLDNVVDMNEFVPARGHNPGVPEIKETTLQTRKLGLGVMGTARMLFKLGLAYDSEEGRRFVARVYAVLDTASKERSIQLAEKHGAFPYMRENWDECISFYTQLWKKRADRAAANGDEDIAERYRQLIPMVQAHGMRNSTTTTVAPTGTLSIIADTSGGCEPEFALVIERNQAGIKMMEMNPVLIEALKANGFQPSDIEWIMGCLHKTGGSLKLLLESGLVAGSPAETTVRRLAPVFVVAGDIAPRDHVLMQAAFQQYNDSATSKTINFPQEATIEDVSEAYDLAIETGCKGITIYRDGSRDHQPLTAGSKVEKVATVAETDPIVSVKQTGEPVVVTLPSNGPRRRPMRLFGFNDRIETGDGRLHLQIGYDGVGIREVIATIGKAGGVLNGLVEALGRLISLALKYRVPIDEVIAQLRGIRSANSYGFGPRQVLSIPDAIGKALSDAPSDLVATTSDDAELSLGISLEEPEVVLAEHVAYAAQATVLDPVHDYGESPECPSCGSPMKLGEGCRGGMCTDPSCGFARC